MAKPTDGLTHLDYETRRQMQALMGQIVIALAKDQPNKTLSLSVEKIDATGDHNLVVAIDEVDGKQIYRFKAVPK